MRIGIIETGIPPHKIGGAEKQAWHLARHLACKRHEVTIYTGRYGGAPKFEIVDGIRIFRIGKLPRPLGIITYILFMLLAVVRDRQPPEALICFRAWPNGAVGYLAMKLKSIPACFSVRGGDWYFVKDKRWGKYLYSLLLSSSMPCLVQSQRMKQEIQTLFPNAEMHIIGNGIEIPAENYGQGDDVVFLGNLLPRKGVNILLKAAANLNGCPLTIIGDGPERTMLEESASSMNVSFLGRVIPQHGQELLKKRAKMVVLPAVAGEGLPNVLMESMALGIPVIATNVAGIADLLDDGKAGLLVPPGDVSALRQAIQTLLKDEQYRVDLAKAGKQAITQYHWDVITCKWESLLQEIINDKEL